jgi:glycosyltransferase involved in cell wall biosynthesis
LSRVIAVVAYCFDPAERDAETWLEHDPSVGVWGEAAAAAGAGPVTVVQRFVSDRRLQLRGVDYRFVADGEAADVPPWYWGGRMAEALRALRPEAVHVHGMVYPVHLRLLRSRLGPRVTLLMQDHGGIHADSPGFGRWYWRNFYRWGLAAADGFLFSARAQAAPWQRAGIIRPNQPIYEIMESSTELAGFSPRPGDQVAKGNPALLWVGRLDANKDPLTILTGFERALATLQTASLTMVYSSDELLPEVQQRIDGSPTLRGRVHLLGRLPQRALPALYASADLFVLGSHHEAAGYSVIEALAFGATPVVADIPSFRSLTDGGRIGALFRVGDAGDLTLALQRVGASDLKTNRAAVRAHFEEHFSWPALGRRSVAIYREAIERTRTGYPARPGATS